MVEGVRLTGRIMAPLGQIATRHWRAACADARHPRYVRQEEVPISRGAEPANRDFTMSSDVGRHLNAITRRPLIRLGDVNIVG
jgi:hypothetical protein